MSPVNIGPHLYTFIMCANVFVRKDGKYLMIKRSPEKKFAPGVVHPIGGKVDAGESPFQAAEREVLEETGIRVKNMRLEAVFLEVNAPPRDPPVDFLIFHFSADYASGEITETDEGELLVLAPEEIPKQGLFPSVSAVIHHMLDPMVGTVFARFEYDDDGRILKERTDVSFSAL